VDIDILRFVDFFWSAKSLSPPKVILLRNRLGFVRNKKAETAKRRPNQGGGVVDCDSP